MLTLREPPRSARSPRTRRTSSSRSWSTAQTYGGGGIFNLYSTVAADSVWAPYIFIHEFGHHFAGLADEYYTSQVAYLRARALEEPWEPNVTALLDPANLKWKDLVARACRCRRPGPRTSSTVARNRRRPSGRGSGRRTGRSPRSTSCSRQQQARDTALLATGPYAGRVGAFEGANYLEAATTGRRKTASCSPGTWCRSARSAGVPFARIIDLVHRRLYAGQSSTARPERTRMTPNGRKSSSPVGSSASILIASRRFRRLGQGDHVRPIYDATDEQLVTAAAFITVGLDRDERCIYIADDRTTVEVIDALGVAGRRGRPPPRVAQPRGADQARRVPARRLLRPGDHDRVPARGDRAGSPRRVQGPARRGRDDLGPRRRAWPRAADRGPGAAERLPARAPRPRPSSTTRAVAPVRDPRCPAHPPDRRAPTRRPTATAPSTSRPTWCCAPRSSGSAWTGCCGSSTCPRRPTSAPGRCTWRGWPAGASTRRPAPSSGRPRPPSSSAWTGPRSAIPPRGSWRLSTRTTASTSASVARPRPPRARAGRARLPARPARRGRAARAPAGGDGRRRRLARRPARRHRPGRHRLDPERPLAGTPPRAGRGRRGPHGD